MQLSFRKEGIWGGKKERGIRQYSLENVFVSGITFVRPPHLCCRFGKYVPSVACSFASSSSLHPPPRPNSSSFPLDPTTSFLLPRHPEAETKQIKMLDGELFPPPPFLPPPPRVHTCNRPFSSSTRAFFASPPPTTAPHPLTSSPLASKKKEAPPTSLLQLLSFVCVYFYFKNTILYPSHPHPHPPPPHPHPHPPHSPPAPPANAHGYFQALRYQGYQPPILEDSRKEKYIILSTEGLTLNA